MSKKDFEAIAQTIRGERTRFKSNTAHVLFARSIAYTLREANSRFDYSRFLLACMPPSYVGTAKSNVWEREARKPLPS